MKNIVARLGGNAEARDAKERMTKVAIEVSGKTVDDLVKRMADVPPMLREVQDAAYALLENRNEAGVKRLCVGFVGVFVEAQKAYGFLKLIVDAIQRDEGGQQ